MKSKVKETEATDLRPLHVKYRPTRLEDVLGQDRVTRAIEQTLTGKTATSFLFTGPSGCGKTTLARIVAARVGCDQPREIDAASFTGVDAMRDVARLALFKPLGGGATAIIVDECHRLSGQAWDALLKIIEEPPEGVYWLFCTTVPEKVPKTIQTRCATFNLRELGADELAVLLDEVCGQEGVSPSPGIIDICAERADGSPRQALVFLAKVWECESRKDAAKLLQVADDAEDNPAILLCRALMNGEPWEQLMAAVKSCKGMQAESVRIIVCAYFEKVAVGAKDENSKKLGLALMVLRAFAAPYPGHISGLYPIVLSLGAIAFPE